MNAVEADALPRAIRRVPRRVWRSAAAARFPGSGTCRSVPEETPIAFSYEGAAYAVMMATPADLVDFAVGFSLSEQIIASPQEIETLETVSTEEGILLRMTLAEKPACAYWKRRRRLAGPSGCGLCGLESLAEAARMPPRVSGGISVPAATICEVMPALSASQPLGRATRALHAAALWLPREGIVAAREDVGRHNALDKLIGAVSRDGISARAGAVLLTSRVSVEMVQKTAVLGTPILVAVSAPTALAVRVAEAAGITLVAVARQDGFEVFSHPQRILTRDAGQPAAAD
jgi:FdhD protein